MTKKIVILGGGVGGMSAAQELAERGFEVEVFERQLIPGGKARSIPVFENMNDHGGKINHTRALEAFRAMHGADLKVGKKRPWLPGEHGFRFFPNFYRHVVDSMGRIPYGKGHVVDNLVDTTRIVIALYDKPGIELPSRFPRNPADVLTVLKDFLYAISPRNEIPYADIEHFAGCIWRIITSCEKRRFEEYEKIGWWEFIGAEGRSEGYKKFLAIGITRSLVAARPRTASAKTIGDIFVQLLFGILTPGVASDRLLNGPTNLVWVQPWLDYLRSLGVTYHFDAEVKAINCASGKIQSATVEIDGHSKEVTGDYFIAALPVERIAPLVTAEMSRVDPKLAGLQQLATNVQWMNGIQYYLTRDVKITHGHAIFIDSPWALTSVSQRQFWPNIDFANWGDGKTKGLLSIDISQWDTPGFNGKAAKDCTRQVIADEVWLQLKRSLNVNGQVMLRDEDLHYWFLDPDITDDPSERGRMTDVEPLLVNRVNTWRLRPNAATAIPNLMLASDYVRTWTDLATMEGANEAARRACNAILDRSGSTAPRAKIWNLHEPEIFALLRAYDEERFNAGLPWDDRFATAAEAALSLVQQTSGMTGGGKGPLAAIGPLAATASTPPSETAGEGNLITEIASSLSGSPETADSIAGKTASLPFPTGTESKAMRTSRPRVRMVQKA